MRYSLLRSALLGIIFGAVWLAAPRSVAAQATTQAQEPGGWCQKCVVPGTCVDTGSGEWGYTYCKGLGNNQCEVGGHTCKWTTGAMNTVVEDLPLDDGATLAAVPVAPYVWIGADCETGSVTLVRWTKHSSRLVAAAGTSVTPSQQS